MKNKHSFWSKNEQTGQVTQFEIHPYVSIKINPKINFGLRIGFSTIKMCIFLKKTPNLENYLYAFQLHLGCFTMLNLLLSIWSVFLWSLCLAPVSTFLSIVFFFSKYIKCHLPTIWRTKLHYCSCLFFIQKTVGKRFRRFFFYSFYKQKITVDDICSWLLHGSVGVGGIWVFLVISDHQRDIQILSLEETKKLSYESYLLL